jgi:predicted ATPase with chaperone activity
MTMTTSQTPPNSKTKANSRWQPPIIDSLEQTGLDAGFLQDLVLKVMYFRGQITGHEIADQLCLPFQAVLAPIMDFIKREQMCEVKGSGGLGTGSYQYLITAKGAARAREQLERTTYAGAAPVPWEDYVKAMKAQGRKKMKVTPRMMKKALVDLVMEDEVFDKIGPAVNSGKSIFLYGAPGNGKTTIAECIGRMVLLGDMYIPYSVIIDGQIVKVYDEINHEAVPEEENGSRALTTGTLSSRRDRRWIRIRRPVIMVGGELTLDGLELIYDRTNKFYEAPFQMKANGGLFLIDDFGRQQVRPRDLLNRWIVPMEKQIDFLALHTGSKVEVPFEVLLVFSTNLPPRDLVDEAFLRRIRHKIHVTSPTYDGYREIFQRVAMRRGIPYDEQTVVYLLQEHYVKKNRKLRANHPRDLLDQIMDIAAYLDVPPRLTVEMIDRAADAYFVEL